MRALGCAYEGTLVRFPMKGWQGLLQVPSAALPGERQTLMFSATFEGEIARIAKQLLRNPKTIQIAAQQAKHEHIEQRLHFVDDMTHNPAAEALNQRGRCTS